ncbi:MAG: veratrol--corrinoid protein metyltransferase [Oscillospiraceae bacterium]|nr:veratrol--corrinoid protein metyltransferase [Oscillospiraceae bacterium]
MTGKENYLRLLSGEMPEWIPSFYGRGEGGPPHSMMVSPKILSYHRIPGERTIDCFGVPYVSTEEANGGKIPEPGYFILKDIKDWRDVIKAPDISDIDFEADAKAELEKIDRAQTAVSYDLNASTFQLLVSFMGFNEGLCAMFEEPDEVKALLQYCSDFVAKINEICLPLYRPDIVAILDDTATWRSPFISAEMYRDLIKPFHARQAKLGTDMGAYVTMHNCGRCEDFIEDWLDMGVSAWDPAQTSNDLVGIKKKYGRRLALCGCWDSQGRLNDPGATEAEIKQAVYDSIDKFAPGGGFMFGGGFMALPGDEVTAQKNKWVREAFDEYGKDYYANH